MQQEVDRLDEGLVGADESLDRRFRERKALPDLVLQASLEAAELQGLPARLPALRCSTPIPRDHGVVMPADRDSSDGKGARNMQE